MPGRERQGGTAQIVWRETLLNIITAWAFPVWALRRDRCAGGHGGPAQQINQIKEAERSIREAEEGEGTDGEVVAHR